MLRQVETTCREKQKHRKVMNHINVRVLMMKTKKKDEEEKVAAAVH